ncbi:MAG: hypothetical protein JSS51_01205 [Planctomycetes bacterium]|nr:hypothetical protein [Planctomycetota bacterium]
MPRPHLVLAIGQAFAWHRELMRTGESIESLARRIKVADSHIHRQLALTHLSPSILSEALSGRLRSRITISDLVAAGQQLAWSKQVAAIGPKQG